MNLGDKPV